MVPRGVGASVGTTVEDNKAVEEAVGMKDVGADVGSTANDEGTPTYTYVSTCNFEVQCGDIGWQAGDETPATRGGHIMVER